MKRLPPVYWLCQWTSASGRRFFRPIPAAIPLLYRGLEKKKRIYYTIILLFASYAYLISTIFISTVIALLQAKGQIPATRFGWGYANHFICLNNTSILTRGKLLKELWWFYDNQNLSYQKIQMQIKDDIFREGLIWNAINQLAGREGTS